MNLEIAKHNMMALPLTQELRAENLAQQSTAVVESAHLNVSFVDQFKLRTSVRVSEQSSMAGALVHGRRRHCFKMTTRHHRFGHEQWPLLKTRGEIIGGDSETFFSPTRTIPIVNLYDTRKAIAVPIVEYNIYDNRICILNVKFSIALQSRDQWEWIMQTFRFKKGQKKK